ncbi:MAG: CocE/NonD family hydrolase [Planctomycetota bacterium]|jgi:putative CocE/NonD family hydrolase
MRPTHTLVLSLALTSLALSPGCSTGQRVGVDQTVSSREYVRQNYDKREYMIPMRDGVELFTAVYTPRNTSVEYPMLMMRTPYSCAPYGEDEYRRSVGPSRQLMEDKYIFVYQDVRGKYMSEGEFTNMTPHDPDKRTPSDIDESSDTYDTIEWLINNIPNHNGRVGQWGISYPGFYAAAGMIDHHPALVASSPQAPISDWWYDDFHHHGAFFLPHCFNFIASFGQPRPEPTTERGERFDHGTRDGYQFFLDTGSIRSLQDEHLQGNIEFWNELIAHPNYDDYWQSRNILPHLRNAPPAVLTVGGLFDAEDLYGPWNIYAQTERNNPDIDNYIIMGPWVHGGWARGRGDRVGNVHFGDAHSEWYREEIEFRFFDHYLKDGEHHDLMEATVFDSGALEWREFDRWPPTAGEDFDLYMDGGGGIAFDAPADDGAFDEFISDPNKPVPFTTDISLGMTRNYMTDDQRFSARRPDVLTYTTDVLEEDITLVGELLAELWVSTSETDADWIVKLVDVFPPDAEDHDDVRDGQTMSNYHMMVRSEVIRGRFRNSPSEPEPFTPYEPTLVELPLQGVLHTFKKGHKIQIQIQSTWFPLIDRNPQKYVENIWLADDEDFTRASHRVYRSSEHSTRIRATRLPSE